MPIDNGSIPSEHAQPHGLASTTRPPQLLLRVSEAAEVLGICRSSLYELLYAGRIPSVKIGHSRRIRQRDLETFVRDLADVS